MAEEAVLGFLEKNEEITDSGQFAAERGINHDEIINIIKSLNGFRLVDAKVLLLLSLSIYIYAYLLLSIYRYTRTRSTLNVCAILFLVT